MTGSATTTGKGCLLLAAMMAVLTGTATTPAAAATRATGALAVAWGASCVQVPAPSPSAAAPTSDAQLRDQVWQAEEAFAGSMADRDLAAFTEFLSPEAVFWSGGIARGPEAIVAAWRGYFEGPTPPFSWRPETVEVLASGTLAFSSGPVLDPGGRRVGTFNSVWRRHPDGRWRVVFDKGCPAPPPSQP